MPLAPQSSRPKPHILLSNDDGIFAPGLRHLWLSLRDFARLTIVAPSSEQSGRSTSISVYDPIHLHEVDGFGDSAAYRVEGTPADCIKIALSTLLNNDLPDMVVSGINRGSNSGSNVLYSGTVGCVIESSLRNIPGVAISCEDYVDPNYHVAEKHVVFIIDYILNHPLKAGTLLNVSVPSGELTAIKGMRFAKQGMGRIVESPVERIHPKGFRYYWLGHQAYCAEEEPESDVELLKQGYITLTPIHIGDLTAHDEFEKHQSNFTQYWEKALIKANFASKVGSGKELEGNLELQAHKNPTDQTITRAD